jgi:hypothetical protein
MSTTCFILGDILDLHIKPHPYVDREASQALKKQPASEKQKTSKEFRFWADNVP